MKILLKLLLMAAVLAGALYASAPVWLPSIISRQLPDGWHLDSADVGYPGFSETRISSLKAHGKQHATRFKISATDIRFSYTGPQTEIGTLVIDTTLPASQDGAAGNLEPEAISLPVLDITGRFPRLEVNDLRLLMHHQLPLAGGSPLALNFQALRIEPAADDGFDAAARFTLENRAFLDGRVTAMARPNRLDAEARFPAGEDATPWLTISFQQRSINRNTTTRLDAVLDTDLMGPALLDPLVAEKSPLKLTGIGGKLNFLAEFSGEGSPTLKQLSLDAPDLKLTTDNGVVDLQARLLASRADQGIVVTLAGPARLGFQDTSGLIDKLQARALPGFGRAARSGVKTLTSFDPNSRVVIQTGKAPAVRYTGDLTFEMTSSDDRLTLHATGLDLAAPHLSGLDALQIDGAARLDWKQESPLTYTSGDQVLKADGITVEMDMSARDGSLTSNGSSTINHGGMPGLAATTERIDVQWRDLDLASLTGQFDTRTRGLAVQLQGKTWTGFDLDVAYRLKEQTRIAGAGSLKIANGPELPLEFSGNMASNEWQIALPPTTLKLQSMPRVLAVGQLKLPEAASLSGGFIDVQGRAEAGQRLDAQFQVRGYDLAAGISKSMASGSGFELAVQLDDTLRADGPVSIETVSLAGGVDITNARADLSLQNMDDFALDNIHAELFDGQLKLDSLTYSDNRLGETTARLSQINFGRLLEYADIDGLAGTGTLDLSLPLGSDAGGIYVKNGVFTSTGPGRIAYTREGMADSNIGFKALENFHFKELSGTLNYQSDGNYRITIHLEGRNPDLYGGHPIVFNLNIGGILPALFEALFMTGDFEESILKQLRINDAQNAARSG